MRHRAVSLYSLAQSVAAKSEAEEPTLRLAVLIDADNSQVAVIDLMRTV